MLAVSLWRRLAMLNMLSFDWDEGVYWQSLESMRHGHHLFAEVFSSQPPFFLAGLSPIYNLLGGGIVAGRLPVMVGTLASLVAILVIGRSLGGTWTGVLAMSFAAFDPLYLELSDRLQADMPCVVVGVVAVAVAAHARRRGSQPWVWFLAGAILGLSIMTKLLGVVFVVPVAWLVFSTDGPRWRRFGAGALGMALAVAAALAPFAGDLNTVYRQAIGLHLGARVSEPQSLGEKLQRIRDSYPAVAPALAALVTCVAAVVRRAGWVGMLVAWLATALAADLAQGPLFIHHLLVLAPPMALLAGAAPALVIDAVVARRQGGGATLTWFRGAVVGAAIVVIAALGVRAMTGPMPVIDPSNPPTIAAIRAWVPAGVVIVTDEPFSAAYSGHPVPPNLVDQSHARITSGELTTARVEADTQAAGARAVVFSTGRLDTLVGFQDWVAQHFRLVYNSGSGLQVWIRDHN